MSLLDKATIITTPTSHSEGKLHSIKGGSVADFDVVRGSAATRVNAQGLIEDVATNIPRIDYTGGTASILLEPQSTNLIAYSEDFSDASWTKTGSASITSSYGVSPSGTISSSRFLTTDNSFLYESVNVTQGVEYTFSIWVKSNNNSLDNFRIHINGDNSSAFTATSNWQKFQHTFTSVNASHNFGLVGDTLGSDLEIWGAQLEELPYATSYIPTSGAMATRLADKVTGAWSTDLINSTEGVLYAEIARSEEENLYRLLGIDDGTSNNYIKMGYGNASGNFWIRAVINGVTVISSDNALTSNPNEFYKIAIRYQSGNSAIYINGTSILTTTTAFSSGNFTSLDFNHWNNSLNFFGKTKAVSVWKEALSDEELTWLTTI